MQHLIYTMSAWMGCNSGHQKWFGLSDNLNNELHNWKRKIKNTGTTDIKGYLLIQIQFYNTTQIKWLVDNDTVNETSLRTINSSSQLALDTIFNGLVQASDLTHGNGTYRVYAAFRDPEGNILRTNDDIELEAWWEFNKD